MKYFTFGMKVLRITQSYNSTYSHKSHWYNSKDYSDYPIDIAEKDLSDNIYYATCDMRVTAKRGTAQGYTNTIWLVTTDTCKTPIGNCHVFIALTHWNDNDPYTRNLNTGSIVKAGQPICKEGKAGADANHLHLVVGNADRGCGDNLIKNSNGKWVSNGYCMRPEQLMYIDTEFTQIVDTKDIRFEDKPLEEDFLPERGWYQEGDQDEHIQLIDDFYAGQVLGNYFGIYTKYLTMAFQDKYNVPGGVDGNIGINTLNKMKEMGLSDSVKPSSSYYHEGDSGNNISLINSFLSQQVKGDYFGTFTKYGTKALQDKGKQEGHYDDTIDGNFGAKTLACAEYYGFNY